jgi:outer membrane receptor protein involved in Fe transport
MNYPCLNRRSSCLLVIPVMLLGSLAHAQTKPAAPTPVVTTSAAPITLSAFEVSTDRDVGYTASSALAGGRVDTLLKETPSAISVLTAEFLEDIGATSFGTAAEWAPNSIPVGDLATTGEHNTNIRGVGNSFPSRNYFRWYVSSDSYNTERLEFARGPNSILFGDGNPGGINTTFTKQALWVPRRTVQFRTDSYGGYRANFDYNLPVNQRFAIRINAVSDQLKGWRDYDEPFRYGTHIAATFKIARETQVRGEYEQGNYRRFSWAQSFRDQSSAWNRTTVYNGVTAPSTTGTGVARFNAGVNDDYLVYDPSQASLGIVNWRGFYQSTGTNLRLLPEGRPVINRFPALPSREFSLQPPNAYGDTNYHSWTFYLEHRFQAGIIAQLAFNHQDQSRLGEFRVWDQHRIDVNTVLPNGQPNPNFGKAFVDVTPQKVLQENVIDDLRLSLAYKKQLRWVRQSLSVSSGIRHDSYSPVTWTAGRVNNPANPNSQAATNVFWYRQYWDAPRNPAIFDQLLSNGSDIRYVESTTSDEDQSLQYNQLASASTLLNGRLSLLLGYRYDTHQRKQQRRVAGNPDGTSILGATDGPGTLDVSKVSVGTSSAGAVFFPIPWLGAYFNYSESFNAPGSGASQLDGTTIPPSSNEGIDLGLKLEFFGGKLAGTIGYYKMQQTERARAGDAMADINEIWNDLGRPENQILAFRDLETYKGTGYEIDLTANLTRSWRLMLNYSLPKTEQADIGPGLRAYVAQHMAAWQAGANNPNLPNRARVATNISDINRIISGYTEGRTLNNTVEKIGNIYTTYSFREGRLKGFSIGGGANYRGRQVVGNVTNQPFNYLYANPYTIVSAHTSYELRFRKIRTRLQLNVSNLLDEQEVVYTAYASNAAAGGDVPNTFRYQAPRKYSLTATFNF